MELADKGPPTSVTKHETVNMKFPIPFLRHLLLGVFLFLSLSISAQYSSDNSFMLRALVKYDLEANGLYGKKENLMVTEVSNEAQPLRLSTEKHSKSLM